MDRRLFLMSLFIAPLAVKAAISNHGIIHAGNLTPLPPMKYPEGRPRVVWGKGVRINPLPWDGVSDLKIYLSDYVK